jgi:ribose transport system ATP-binding protein
MIAEDRRGRALVTGLSVKENTVLSVLDKYSRWGIMNDRSQEKDTAEQIAVLSIKTSGPSQRVEELSGGNQQKVAFAKAMMGSPRIMLCDEPTQAVDVKTRREIQSLLRSMADRGQAVVFVSSDLKETLELADRIQIIARGKGGVCFDNINLNAEQVLGACCAG